MLKRGLFILTIWKHVAYSFCPRTSPSDAVKRRTLPAWIREGLEKMDREKQKKLERERMEKERAKMAKDDSKDHEADEEGDGPRVPRKSKFVSNPVLTPNCFILESSCEFSLK